MLTGHIVTNHVLMVQPTDSLTAPTINGGITIVIENTPF